MELILKACPYDVFAAHIPTTTLDIADASPTKDAVYIFMSADGDTFVNNTSGQKFGSAILTNDKCQRI
jgi:predicted outer membrane repeat protein